MTQDELIALLRQKCDEWGGVTAFAKAHKQSRRTVQDVVTGRTKPGTAIPRILGYKLKPAGREAKDPQQPSCRAMFRGGGCPKTSSRHPLTYKRRIL